MGFIRGAFWLSLVGPELDKAKTKNWEVGSHCPSLDHSRPVAAEVVIWLPGLVAPNVLGYGFLVMYCLAIAHLYISFSLSRNYIWGLVLIVPSTKWYHVVRWVINRIEILSLHSHFLLIPLTNLGFSTKVVINVLILDCIFCLKLWPKFRFCVLMFTACLYTPAFPLLSSGVLRFDSELFPVLYMPENFSLFSLLPLWNGIEDNNNTVKVLGKVYSI